MNEKHTRQGSHPDRTDGRTDWARADGKSDADLARDMRADPDWSSGLDIDWSSAEIGLPVRKEAISIRLDEDVVGFFREQGPGYQRKINAVLRHYMTDARRKRRG